MTKADTKSCMRLANFAILKLLRPVLVSSCRKTNLVGQDSPPVRGYITVVSVLMASETIQHDLDLREAVKVAH